ncbi:transglutaminase family protein [Alteromonas gilva]|uniref:DUF3488 and transglutaminase-like domain-containing protein n=1 Tax=Alteromonas gilva TaxID=2987522 RepID=A0ABT5L390_9ALTE|nr:DUF3488 and transglutaminase-like domain-containing protein [Alteromonas gilva]MDC8831505.1 DUF3488 and transglutaminase-like domain-containing protein [Alteromonas gilva]
MQPIDKPIKNQLASALIAAVFCILSISLYEPLLFWVLLIALCATGIRLIMFVGWYQPVPSVRTVNLLAILSCVCLAWFSFQVGLLITMVNLLILAGALKLIILNRARDLFHLFCTCLFIVGVGFTFHQSVVMTLFYSLLTLALLVALGRYFAPSQALSWHTKRLLIMSLQALPVTLILFVIVPKLPPLWKMPVAQSNETGLSDAVSPGDIARLTRSADLAFRATFEGPMPAPAERYWRAITLEAFDGKEWTVSPLRKQVRQQYRYLNSEFSPTVSGSWWQYEVIAEPTNNHWLFGIAVAVPADHSSAETIRQTADYQLVSETPLTSKRAYRLRSYPDTVKNQSLFSLDQRINLQLPANADINPKTQRWAAQIVADNATPQAQINAVMNYFVEQQFSYTLTPPPMPTNTVDDFLFNHREGFCAHYASAMAYTLRLMGIPSRMVAGYHGGETLQPSVLSVYQYDAHAWVEAWFDERGWVRFDPTAMAAPQRIELGLQQAVDEAAFLANNQLARLQQFPLFSELRTVFSLIDYQWSRWVLGFNAERQQNLLELLLGKVTTERLMWLMLGICLLIALLLALYFVPHWQRQRPPANRIWYQRAADKAEQLTGLARQNLGPQAYADRVSNALEPQAATQFNALSEAFIVRQYRPHSATRFSDRAFKKLCRQFVKHGRAKPTLSSKP